MTVCLHRALQHKTMKPRVGLCEGFCAYPAGRMASVYLRGTETQCWGLCAPLSQKAILPLKYQEQRRRNCGKAGQFTQPSRNAFAAQSADFPGHSRSAKCQGKGNAEGSILKQDKSPVPQAAPGRSQRPAVRAAFRAFPGQGRNSGNCLESLVGIYFWRHFQAEKTLLASGLPENQLFQGIGTASVLRSQALLAEKVRFFLPRRGTRLCLCPPKILGKAYRFGPPAGGKIGPVPQEKRL